ncbi:MAG: hydrolase [Alishewanella sp. 34-51-39]|nr:MAG: hydrolase [Alishewanella sp. 34-51-39]
MLSVLVLTFAAPLSAEILAQQLPGFYQQLKAEQQFSAAWRPDSAQSIQLWRTEARQPLRDALLWPEQPLDFAAEQLMVEQRDGYQAERWQLNLTPENRVSVSLLRPAGEGPFPAVLLLHDHGAYFLIGKAKLIKPFARDPDLAKAEAWTKRYYDGRFIGDELARSLAGLAAYEDLRLAAFLAQLPQVDNTRIAALGFSMGGFRAWQLAALTDDIKAAATISWMTTSDTAMTPGNNQLRGQTAFWMLHPGLAAKLDYPHLAGIAAPKPALFISGAKDRLMPAAGTEQAFATMRQIWQAHGAGEKLMTELWPEYGHQFSAAQQQRVWRWLEEVFAKPAP